MHPTRAFVTCYCSAVVNGSYVPSNSLCFFVNQLAGGTAALQQMKERLEKDLMEVSNGHTKLLNVDIGSHLVGS
jgi:hypothetical protein